MAKSPARKASSAAGSTGSGARKRRLAKVAGYLSDSSARELDRLVYERIRLGIVSALAVNDRLTFSELKQLFELTDGNLSAHARKLEQAGYVTCRKSFDQRTPRSEYRLTAKGRRALEHYLDHMEALISATRSD